jgi:hypothetical protein
MFSSTVTISTTNPSRIIRRLCKHWGHKFEVSFDDHQGSIALGDDHCQLNAAEGSLTAVVKTADESKLERLQTVVADHIQRMSSEETFTFNWTR